MSPDIDARFLDTDYDETSIHPEILPAVRSIRNSGVETIASHSGIRLYGPDNFLGSYIQVRIFTRDGFEVARKIAEFADALTVRMQQDLQNPTLTLQLISAEAWFKDRNTTSMETLVPIYRLQLVGHSTDEEICHVWSAVAQNFTPGVIE